MKKLKAFPQKPNILIIMTDQQRAYQHWPEGWPEKNLPAMSRLMKNGITFKNGFSNANMCSPSRATFFTGLYPSQHRVTEVLNSDNSNGTVRDLQQIMRSDTQNMARILESAGYDVFYKGKWHITKPVTYFPDTDDSDDVDTSSLGWTNKDALHIANKWGFKGWNPPDAGDTVTAPDMGGGSVNNDGRFVSGQGTARQLKLEGADGELAVKRSAVNFLNNYKSDKPFCLIVSLVNPHDVLAYPGEGLANNDNDVPIYQQGGYKEEDFENLPIELPETWNEDLSTKPSVQQSIKETLAVTMGPMKNEEQMKKYCRFYAYLHTVVDQQIEKVLKALDKNNLTEDTLIIRVSDHGEMGMAHGGLRQKLNMVYEECTKVPIIFSNPILFPKPVATESLASLVDIMPTLANLCGVPDRDRWTFKGVDLSPVLENPAVIVQDSLHFTYDDYDSTYDNIIKIKNLSIGIKAPANIRSIREKDWKYAVYFDPNTGKPMEFEMYHLSEDPLEQKNLAHPTFRTPASIREQVRLHLKLTRKMKSLGTVPDRVIWPEVPPVLRNKFLQAKLAEALD